MNRLETLLHELGAMPDEPTRAAQRRALADAALARARSRTRRLRALSATCTALLLAAVAVGVHTLPTLTRTLGVPAAPPAPWGAQSRVTVLLLGSDAGDDRAGVRTDSVVVANIDTRTGDTVLVGVPRSLQHVPFPPGTPMAALYPHGYACPDQSCLLNALWEFGTQSARRPDSPAHDYYRRFPDPGLRAVVDAVEGVTGLRIDQSLVMDLRAFAAFVDAVGGVDVDVRRPIPVGGHEVPGVGQVGVTTYIRPGPRHLDGYDALWFARSRSDSSDEDRMRRQRCVLAAITRQLDPISVARAFPALAAALRGHVSTTIRVQDLGAWAALAMKMRVASLRSLVLDGSVIDPARPDIRAIHALVARAIGAEPASAGTPAASRTPRHDTAPAVTVESVC